MTPPINRSLRLPPTEHFPPVKEKTGIALHHTVGGSARSTFEWWAKNGSHTGRPRMVGTAYLIDHDGTIYEVFDPSAWAFQFGVEWTPAHRIDFEKRFIGIELASEGGLIEVEGNLYAFDRICPQTWKRRNEAFDYGKPYRGYRYFDAYEPKQVASLIGLMDHLLTQFDIPRRMPDRPFAYYGDWLYEFEGVIGHAMVRRDKSDPAPDDALWDRIITELGVTPVTISPMPKAGRPTMTALDAEQLFAENLDRVRLLDVAAGSLVKGLLIELERRGTYIRLTGAVPDGHVVGWEFVQGVKSDVGRVARALGIQLRPNKLQVVRRG